MDASTPRANRLKVLIAEDNRDVRTTLRMLLTLAYGHIVYEAPDGLRALQIALEERPDVALIDLGLPALDGYEVARRLRENLARDDIFLIALTGYGTDEDRSRAEAVGFDMHLIKPVESAALTRAFARVAPMRPAGEARHCMSEHDGSRSAE